MLTPQLLQAAPLIVMTVAVIFSVFLFLSLKRDFQHDLKGTKRDLNHTQSEIEDLKQTFAGVLLRLQDAEERAGVLVPPQAPRSGLNVSRRTQIIRMSRRGDRAENIAASLSLPRGEVELLLKVHRLAVDGRVQAKSTE